MARRWATKKERHEHMRRRLVPKKRKFFVLIAIMVVFALLLFTLFEGIKTGMDPVLIVILLVAIIVMIPVSIFLIDLFFWVRYI